MSSTRGMKGATSGSSRPKTQKGNLRGLRKKSRRKRLPQELSPSGRASIILRGKDFNKIQ